MARYSDDEILDAVRNHIETDRAYRQQLVAAIETKNRSWIQKLVHFALGVVVEIGRAVIAAITGWFLPRPPTW